MKVVCPSCSSRYQLADSKIKDKGTKVRCPRCSHTFIVHKELPEEEELEKTELFQQRPDAFQPEPPAANKAPPRADDSDIFDEATQVSSKFDVYGQSNKHHQPSDAFNDDDSLASKADEETAPEPSRISSPARPSPLPTMESPPPDIPSEEEERDELRPFGAATIFEIQQSGKKKSRSLKKFGAVASFILVVGGAGYYLMTNWRQLADQMTKNLDKQQAQVAQEVDDEVIRPSGWYRDDPQVYQAALGQIAALPKQEQEKISNQSLLAEALILNGILTGAEDQVIQGLSYVPLLALEAPNLSLSLFPSAAIAVAREDRKNLASLYQRWPLSGRSTPEFKLVEIVHLAQQGNAKQALEQSKLLMAEKPNFQRATTYAVYLISRNEKLAESILTEDEIKKAENLTRRHLQNLSNQLSGLPPLQQELAGYLGLSQKVATPKSPPAEVSKPMKAPKQKIEPPQQLKPQAKAIQKKPPPKPRGVAAPAKKTSPAPSTKLPKASEQLVAQNQSISEDKKQAMTLFNKGKESLKQNDYVEALSSFREALRMDPEFAEVYREMGLIYRQRKEEQRALRALKIYLQLKPDASDKTIVQGWIEELQ